MFSRLAEHNVWPALFSKAQIDPGWSDVDELVTMIDREVVMRLTLKFGQHFLIVALDPTRRRHVNRFKLALDLVFVT